MVIIVNNKKLLDEESLDAALDRLYRIRKRKPVNSVALPYSRSMRLLDIIASQEGVTPGDLAKTIDVRPPTLTEMLNRLENENLIDKSKDKSDQRIVRLSVTKEGQTRLGEVKKDKNERYEDILTNEEYGKFIELCLKLRNGLEEKYCGGEESENINRSQHGRR